MSYDITNRSINIHDKYVYNHVYKKYEPIFNKTSNDMIQIVMDFLGYDDIFDCDKDLEYEEDFVYISKREYKKLQRIKRKKPKYQDITLNVRPYGWKTKN